MAEDETLEHITAHLRGMIEFMAGAPTQFWTREHRAVVYHAFHLARAIDKYSEAEGGSTLVSPVIPGLAEWMGDD